MADENEFEGGGEGEGSTETKFVEVEGKKFVDDGTGQPKKDDNGNPVPFVEQKRQESPADRKARLERELARHKEKHPELYEEKKPEKRGKKSEELDYGQKAYLIAKGIEDAEEVALVKTAMENSGKSLEEVLNASWFKAELKEFRDSKETANATPGNGKRTGSSAANTVEYWLAKSELPPNTPENKKLRQDVVNARIKRETTDRQFTDTPVVGK